jgi:HK97 family phage major capsid protein
MTIAEMRAAVHAALQRMEAAHRSLEEAGGDADLDALNTEFTASEDEHRSASARLERAESVAEARRLAPVQPEETPEETPTPEARVGREPLTYARDNHERSFFRDMHAARMLNDRSAAERLERHMAEMLVERRDLSSADGSGGNLVAPLWLNDEFIPLARAGRPFANAVGSRPLPPHTDSINIPKLLTGTATATQADNGAVQETDATDTSISIPVRTIAGQQDVSRQLLDRSIPGVDSIILADLAADYATKLDVQTLNGSGTTPNAKGVLQDSNVLAITYTDATPTVPELYSKLADAVQQIHTNRFMSPTAIVMHPRRWAWMLAALDTQNRPLISAVAPSNAAGLMERVGAEGVVGQVMGLPVIVDASIPTNLGAGTNEDRIIVSRLEDQVLFEEGQPNEARYFEVLSGNLGVRFQVWGYFGFTSERYSKSNAVISGTGLVAPTF